MTRNISIPDFPEGHGNKSATWRTRKIVKFPMFGSFDPCDAPSRHNGPESKRKPLHYDIDRKAHQTLTEHSWQEDEVPFTVPSQLTMSSDNLYKSYLRDAQHNASSETSSQTSNLASDRSETSSLESGTFEADQDVGVMPEPDKGLCSRCCMINVEILSKEGGYTHSTMEVLRRSARSCRLCRTFWSHFKEDEKRWSLDKHRKTLSLDLSARDATLLKDHHDAPTPAILKCVRIKVVTMEPWQASVGNQASRTQNSTTESESLDPEQLGEVNIQRLRMACYTEEGDPAMYAGVPWLRNVGYTGSARSLNVAKGWLQQCLALEGSHRDIAHDAGDQYTGPSYDRENLRCLAPFKAERPTRLIQIVASDDPDQLHIHAIKLVETNERDYTYVALSYCWGNLADTAWLTTRDTIQQHLEAIDVGSLPVSISDSLQVAVSLGFHHVWVDCLCIIQDDGSDWEVESAKMGGIYKGAILTIAASKSSDSNGGCFNREKRSSLINNSTFSEYTCVESLLRSGDTSRLYFEKVLNRRSWDDMRLGAFRGEVYGSPLFQRAWAYQERILSTRILYFGGTQLHWECEHCVLSQDNLPWNTNFLPEYPVLNFSTTAGKQRVMMTWYHAAVPEYTKRRLTNFHDRLVAISAIAKATYLICKVRYVAGLWEDSLLQGLCWYRYGEGRKNATFRCPSWSWASQESAVSYGRIAYTFREPEQGFQSLVKALDVHVVSSKNNPFGNVKSGHIELRTRVTSGTVMRDEFGDLRSKFDSGDNALDHQALVISERHGRYVWQGLAVLDDDDYKCRNVVVALVNDWHSNNLECMLLLLEHSGVEEHSYRRVGLGTVRNSHISPGKKQKPNFLRDWPEQTITLI